MSFYNFMMTREMFDAQYPPMMREQRKRKRAIEEMALRKKKEELEWRPEDCAQPIGEMVKLSGVGRNKKCHYQKFEFHCLPFELEETVLLTPGRADEKVYVATIKDIYVKGKDGLVYLDVQWFYRPEDVDQNLVQNFESKVSGDIFYSFHRDEISAECVKHGCSVHLVAEDKTIPNKREHPDFFRPEPDFIVRYVYDVLNKKFLNFSDNVLNEEQRLEIGVLVEKTFLKGGFLPDIKKKEDQKTTCVSRRKRSIPKRFIPEPIDFKVVLEKYGMSIGDSVRDEMLGKVFEAMKDECLEIKKKQGDDYCDFVWTNGVVFAVRVLEQAAYDSFGKYMEEYHHKLNVLVENLTDSQVLTRRFLKGELKPEQVVKMSPYELTRGYTLDEMKIGVEEPVEEP